MRFRITDVWMEDGEPVHDDLLVGTDVEVVGWFWGGDELWAVFVWEKNGAALTYPSRGLRATDDLSRPPAPTLSGLRA